MGFDTMLWLLALIAAVGVGCGYAGWRAGWRSAEAYLPAAKAVSEVSNAAIQQANGFTVSLDTTAAALASLQGEVQTNTQALNDRTKAVEDALYHLFTGLERAGLARPGSTRAVPRQVGEPPESA